MISKGSVVLMKIKASLIFSFATPLREGSKTYLKEGFLLKDSNEYEMQYSILHGLCCVLLAWEIFKVPFGQVAVYFVTLNI